MKQTMYFFTIVFFVVVSVATSQSKNTTPSLCSSNEETGGITPQEYRQRRRTVTAKMESGSVAVFCASNPGSRNGDVDYRFRQNDNFLYLTGCNEPNSVLILSPDGIRVDSTTVAEELFFIRDQQASWSGALLGQEGAKRILGFGEKDRHSEVFAIEKLKEILPHVLQSKKSIYFSPALPEFLFDPISGLKFVAVREIRKALAEKYPDLTVKNSGPLLNDLRAVKSSAEIGLLQRAIDATVTGFMEAAKCCMPGMMEYELQAVIEYWFTRMGCEFYGFPSIVGSGPNALSIHYDANRRKMNSGELVVMDIGAETHGYSADLTRTIPVSGSYSVPQREIYELVLNAQASAMKEVRPGIPMNEPGKKAWVVLGDGLLKLGIIKERDEVKKYCPHGISHFIGLDVHDVSTTEKLAPGMIFTMEPGLYIPDSSACDKKYWGIGIRIEDDVLVTEHGCRVLTESAPRTADDIETLMAQRGDARGKNKR